MNINLDSLSLRFLKNEKTVILFSVFFALFTAAFNEYSSMTARFIIMTDDIKYAGLRILATINGYEYSDYPSLMPFLSYISSFGAAFLNNVTVAVPTVLFGAAGLYFTVLTARKFHPDAGLCALAVLFLTYEFMKTYCRFSMDIPVMAAGALMLLLLVNEYKYAPAVFFLLLLFVFFERGFIGYILLGGSVGGYCLFAGKFKRGFLYAAALVLAGGIGCAAGYLLLKASPDSSLAERFISCQILSRFSSGNSNEKNEYFYFFTNALVNCLPVTALAVAGAVFKFKKIFSDRRMRGIAGFILITLFLLSFPSCKHTRYMCITLPGFALISSYWLMSFCAASDERKLLISRIIFFALFAGTAVLSLLSAFVFKAWLALVPAAAALAVFAALALVIMKKPDSRIMLSAVAVSGMLFSFAGAFQFESAPECDMTFFRSAEKIRGGRPLYFAYLDVDHSDLRYSAYLSHEERAKIKYIFHDEFAKSYQKDDPKTHNYHAKMYPVISLSQFMSEAERENLFVTSASLFPALKNELDRRKIDYTVLFSGKLARKKCLALLVKKGGQTEK